VTKTIKVVKLKMGTRTHTEISATL